MEFRLTDAQRHFQTLMREFAEKEVAPHVRDYDREERCPVSPRNQLPTRGAVL